MCASHTIQVECLGVCSITPHLAHRLRLLHTIFAALVVYLPFLGIREHLKKEELI